MLSEPLVKLNSVYVKVQEALLHLRGDLLVGDTGVVGKVVGGTARIFDAPAFYAQQVRQILRKYGSDAHLFVPGPGVPILGPEQIQGTWSQNASEIVTSGSGQGATLTFNNAANGAASNNTGGGLSFAPNSTYQVTYTVSGYTSGSVYFQSSSGGYTGQTRAGNGTYTETIKPTGTSQPWVIKSASNGTTCVVSNISVKEILGYTSRINGFEAANFLESTGNTYAALDGAVGLVLDAAGSVGAELMPAGTAGAVIGAPGALPNGWQGGATVNGITRQVVGIGSNYVDLRLTGTATSTWADYVGVIGTTVSVTPGETYRIEMPETVVIGGAIPSGGGVTYGCATQLSGAFVGQQMGRFLHVTIPAGVNQLRLFNTIANYANGAVIDVTLRVYSTVSAKKVTGTHASQSTTANKPTLRRGVVNLLTQNGDFSNAAWTRTNVSILGSVQAPDGSNTASNLNFVFVSPITRLYQDTTFQSVNGTRYTFAVWMRSATPCKISIGVQRSGPADQEQAEVDVTATWQLFVFSHSGAFTGTSAVRGVIFSYDASFNKNIEVWRPGLFQGTLTAAQIIAAGGIPLTTTAPASSQYGAYAWELKDNSKFLPLQGPLFQMGDDQCFVCAARLPDVTGVSAIFDQRSTSTITPIVGKLHISGGSIQGVWRDNVGATLEIASGPEPVVNNELFVASYRKVGNVKIARKNGIAGAANNTALGAATIQTATIGASVSTSTSQYANGLIYPCIAIKGTVSDSELKVLEKWLGSIAGVSIA